MSLPCLNCKTPVEPAKAKVYSGVFVCPQCYEIAERVEQRALGELKALQLLLRENIRVALIEGKLELGPEGPARDLTKKEVLEQVLVLSEKADQARMKAST